MMMMMEEEGSDSADQPQHYSKFTKSLQELKDLCSQLHAAAEYCESTFLKANHKHLVVENTKKYVCSAVVAVVDHLGSVSANLDYHISEIDTTVQTAVRIDFLKQKLFTCQEYSDRLALAKLNWRVDTPRYNSRYLKPSVPDVLSRNISLRDSGGDIIANTYNIKQGFKLDEEIPLLFYTCIYKSSPSRFGRSVSEKDEETSDSSSFSGLPISGRLSVSTKPQALSVQLQDKHKHKRGTLFRKSMTSGEILSFIRRRK
ncbi:probable protein ABIL5 isoform X2 [Cynara cardunculus var. scolymus]|uniref:probable protein ABIL5 isoform X2 n=1 Tax=Cynara cardunculus var. scolymus TaxID=59895 RepID=UPI000D630278|nr:probable protein ABIL5 isoform X2 [Cynara cardunculus var. scolymus]